MFFEVLYRDRSRRNIFGVTNIQMSKEYEDWDLFEVAAWLKYCDLHEAVDFFLKHGMDGLTCSGMVSGRKLGKGVGYDLYVALFRYCVPHSDAVVNARLQTAIINMDELSKQWRRIALK